MKAEKLFGELNLYVFLLLPNRVLFLVDLTIDVGSIPYFVIAVVENYLFYLKTIRTFIL